MNSFWTEHWWAIPMWLGGIALMIAAIMFARRNPDARRSRVIFFLFPQLDPTRERSSVSMLKVWFGFLILFVLIVMDVLD